MSLSFHKPFSIRSMMLQHLSVAGQPERGDCLHCFRRSWCYYIHISGVLQKLYPRWTRVLREEALLSAALIPQLKISCPPALQKCSMSVTPPQVIPFPGHPCNASQLHSFLNCYDNGQAASVLPDVKRPEISRDVTTPSSLTFKKS